MNYPILSQSTLLVSPEVVQVPFRGNVYTDELGYRALTGFHHQIVKLQNQTVRLKWQQGIHFDANLSALLLAIIRRLSRENNVRFLLDEDSLLGSHNIFARNGLERAIHGTPFVVDERQSSIPVRCFTISESDDFSSYVQNDMFRHHRLHSLAEDVKQRIGSYFFELFCNVEIHADTDEVFVCGQFFPTKRELRFTMVDLGCGFLQKIAAHTRGTSNIRTGLDAIKWAISGNTTKTQAAGGSGLLNIVKHCIRSNDSVHIITDGCYWLYDQTINKSPIHYSLNTHVPGTTIHMIFRGL